MVKQPQGPEEPFPPPPPDPTSVEKGRLGEQAACRYLWKRGFRVLERNYRGPRGEIDLIVEKGQRLRFVEVKTRFSESLGPPEERVDQGKRQRLRATARHYLLRFEEAPPRGYQFDVLAQRLSPEGRPLEQTLHEAAF